LVKIDGSSDASKTLEMVKSRLASYGLDLKNIFCFTLDGAAVIQEYGVFSEICNCFKIMDCILQLLELYIKITSLNFFYHQIMTKKSLQN
jgi:hypothetical protein